MASELVERLRTAAHWAVSENDHVEPELCNEAAARIEALEARDAQHSAMMKLIADNLGEYIDKNGGTVDVTIALAFEASRAASALEAK